jgi:hypothetical protein
MWGRESSARCSHISRRGGSGGLHPCGVHGLEPPREYSGITHLAVSLAGMASPPTAGPLRAAWPHFERDFQRASPAEDLARRIAQGDIQAAQHILTELGEEKASTPAFLPQHSLEIHVALGAETIRG